MEGTWMRAAMVLMLLAMLAWANQGHSSGAAFECASAPKRAVMTRCTGAPIVIDGTTNTAFTPIATYPVAIPVSDVPGVVKSLSVRVEDLTHNRSNSLRLALQAPDGRALVLRDGRHFGASTPATDVDLEFRDDAVRGSHIGSLVSGRYVTTRLGYPLPAVPAPQSGYGSFLDDFSGGVANGNWRLWIDHRSDLFETTPSQGSIGRVCLDIETADSAAPCEAGSPVVQSGVLDANAPVLGDCELPYIFETVCADSRVESPVGSVCFGVAHSRRGTLTLQNPLSQSGCVTLDIALQGCPAPTSYWFAVDDPTVPAADLAGGTANSSGRAGATSFFLPAGTELRLTVLQRWQDLPCSNYTATLRSRPCFMQDVFADGFEAAAP